MCNINRGNNVVDQLPHQLGTFGSILREASYMLSSSRTKLLSSRYWATWKIKRQKQKHVWGIFLHWNESAHFSNNTKLLRQQQSLTVDKKWWSNCWFVSPSNEAIMRCSTSVCHIMSYFICFRGLKKNTIHQFIYDTIMTCKEK